MMDSVNVVRRSFKGASEHDKKEIDRELWQIKENYIWAKRNGPYLVLDRIIISIGRMSRAFCSSEHALSGLSLAVDLLNLLRGS